MDRKKTTEFLGNLLVSDKFGGFGKYWASEVSIDPWATKGKPKRVDFMQFIPAGQCSVSEIEKGIFVCYEIKKLQAGCLFWKWIKFHWRKELHSNNNGVL